MCCCFRSLSWELDVVQITGCAMIWKREGKNFFGISFPSKSCPLSSLWKKEKVLQKQNHCEVVILVKLLSNPNVSINKCSLWRCPWNCQWSGSWLMRGLGEQNTMSSGSWGEQNTIIIIFSTLIKNFGLDVGFLSTTRKSSTGYFGWCVGQMLFSSSIPRAVHLDGRLSQWVSQDIFPESNVSIWVN